MVSAVDALQRHVSNLKAENLSLLKLNQQLTQKVLLGTLKNTRQKLDRHSTTVTTSMLRISLKADQRFSPYLTREVSELYGDRDALTRNRHSRSKQSYQPSAQHGHRGTVALLFSLTFLSRAEPYISSLSSRISLLDAVIAAELQPDQ